MPRPSRIMIAIARWALLIGLAGVLMGSLALVDVWRAPDNLDGRRTLLLASAILLSIPFMLAPLVRRAFARPAHFASRGRNTKKTLLDEMRERGELGDEPDGDHDSAAAPADSRAALSVKFVIAAYAIFAATLACVLWAL